MLERVEYTAMEVLIEYVRGVEVRNRRTQIRWGNSVHGSGGGSEAFSRNGVPRGERPTAVRTVRTFIYSISTGQLTPNSQEAKLEVVV